MERINISREIASLPPEAQRQVIDFVSFLKTRYTSTTIPKKIRRAKLTDEPFIGIWRDRDDMQDSSAWLHDLRKREWGASECPE